MEDYQLDIMIGQGPSARTIKLDIPRFTLVGATTRAGLLSSPLRDRFGVISRLEFYSHSELTTIVKRSADILRIEIDEEGAREIACRSRGTPRIVNRLLRRVRDLLKLKVTEKSIVPWPIILFSALKSTTTVSITWIVFFYYQSLINFLGACRPGHPCRGHRRGARHHRRCH